ncbi:TetR/AcrR family transcriptional regulator [Streptomyces mutabilis]|jgi:TetR/AcrR family transcriptional regulator, lmrAB and yxaGH operons repressor|uniref:TetR/AcrR family transcriptional regulator n=1 Tax=Streptomyces TaxID=1883 RepID=UPI0025B5E68C|nr:MULTISPECIES: TetR/AcrR family transcriptional regulator [unclassified Streptomyces]MDN3249096.1 TetR/AcrR family transcriptional regulator [Streptomyces sp. ZSW22]MDN3257537.1 TetR/AcrR family transcriptional regulator [Streptomyces sp. MA25(2023)]MDQ0386261.1 AcrR family transcriptional regulator [Streptomyces sp. DSM 42143]
MARTVLDRSDVVHALAGVFRKRGFEGGSLSVIQQETGVGRGSLYHFFPRGKTDMAAAVLEQVSEWFEERIFTPLRTANDAAEAIEAMSQEVAEYFTSRNRVCLFAAMTLGEEQDTFADAVRTYFTDWVDALAGVLRTGGLSPQEAADRALDAVAAIQGGLILARAYGDDATFLGIVARTEQHLLGATR